MTVAGLMNTPKYSRNVIRVGDVQTNAPFTVLNSELGTVIQLPLPLNLTSNMNADWQNEEVGLVRYHLMHNKEAINNAELPSSFKDMIASMRSLGSTLMDKASSMAKNDVAAIRARTRSRSKIGGLKIAKNPRIEMMFNGMQFKSYSFDFMLVPTSQRDSAMIEEAIKEIQKASVPTLRGEKMFMEYPETWNIKFMAGEKDGNRYIMKINECCCTGVTINYTPTTESFNMHEGNAPLSVELTLDFTEIFIPTKETIEEGFSG